MLYLYLGSDREKTRTAINKAVERVVKSPARGQEMSVVRVTDAHAPHDLVSALQGSGMFGGGQVVVFENILSNEEMERVLLDSLEAISKSPDTFLMYEEKIDAAMRKRLEKYVARSERFDLEKRFEDKTAFSLAHALKRGDRKALWLGYVQELAKGNAPEMLHGILFWAAKDMCLKSSADSLAQRRGRALISKLAELPHEARRRGVELEYALEHFVLSLS